MGFVVLFGIAVVIIIILIIVLKEKKKKKDIEELLKSDAYALALKIKEKLESKDKIDRQLEGNGVQNKYTWSSRFVNIYKFYVCFCMKLPSDDKTSFSLLIEASKYIRPIKQLIDWHFMTVSGTDMRPRGYLLENIDNVDNGMNIRVLASETSKEMLEYVVLARSVMLEFGISPKLYADDKLIG